MNKQVLCIVMAAALLLAAVVPMTTPVMAAEFSASKQTQPLLPNIYYVDDVIEYVMTIANPEDNTETNTWTRIWDTLPDGTVVDFLLPGQTLVQPPGTSNTFNYAYTVDEGDLVWLSGPGYWVVRNRFEAEGFDSLDDSIATLVTRNSRVIRPDTRVSIDVDTGVYPDRTVVAGQELNLIISEENTGYDELTDAFVRLRRRVPPATGTPETVIARLDHTDASWTCSGNQDDVLDPGEIWTWTIPVTIAEDTRFIALGFADDPLDNEVSFATGYEDERDTVTITAVNPDIQIKKYTNGNDAYDPGDADVPEITVGDTVTWTYTVTNTGDVNLTGIVVTDDQPGVTPFYVSGDDGDGILNPTETWTYEATGVAEAGLYANIGSVVGYYGAVQVLDSDPSHYRGVARLISLEKGVWDGENWHDADLPTGPYLPSTVNPVVFRFVITNAGTVDLTGVTLDDSHIDDFYTDQGLTTPAAFPIASLASTASVTVYGSLAWSDGQHSNNATATGTPAGEPTPISADDDCHYFGSESSIDIQKAVWDGGAWHDADTATGPYLPDTVDPVVFRFIITNDGNVPLTNVTLSDTNMSDFYTDQGLTNSATFPISTLAANVSATFYGSLDWAIGQHSNTATATGTPPDEPAIQASNDCHYFGVGAYIDLQKAVWHETWHDAYTPTGPYLSDSVDPVVFRFVITNAGSVNLTNIVLADSDIDQFYTDEGLTIPAVFPIASLAPTASVTVYGSLPWTAGQHSNTATATGTPPDNPAISVSDDCHYFGRTVPEITVGWDGESVNKMAVLAPWIAMMMGTIACAVLFVRRRQAQG